MSLQELHLCLAAVQDVDQQIRRQGEVELNRILTLPGSTRLLMEFAANLQQATHFRQLVMVILSQQVHRNWHVISSESQYLIEFAFRGCQDSVGSIRGASMVLVAKCFSHGKQVEQDFILTILVGQLQTQNIDNIRTSLRCIYVIADEIDYVHNLQILRLTFQPIVAIINETDRTQTALLRYAVRVVRACADKICNARMSCGFDSEAEALGDETAIRETISQFTSSWGPVVLTWLSACLTPESIVQSVPVLLELTRSLSSVIQAFPEYCSHFISDIVQNGCMLLANMRDTYRAERSRQGTWDQDGYASDGDRHNIEMLALHIFELLCVALAEPEGLSLIQSHLDPLIVILMDFMQLTADQQDQFTDEANEFVAAEQDDAVEVSLRQRGVDLVQELARAKMVATFGALFAVTQREIASSQSAYDAAMVAAAGTAPGSHAYVAVTESVSKLEGMMWTVGAVLKEYMKLLNKAKKLHAAGAAPSPGHAFSNRAIEIVTAFPPDQLAGWVGSLVQSILSPGSGTGAAAAAVAVPPLLQGRALWLVAQCSRLFNAAVLDSLLLACCQVMSSSLQPLAVRLQACKALANIARRFPKDDTSGGASRNPDFVRAALETCLAVAPLTNDETVHIPLGALLALLKHCPLVVAHSHEVAAAVVQCTLEIWTKNAADALIVDDISCIYQKLLAASGGIGLVVLAEKFLPVARNWLLEQDPRVLAQGVGEPVVTLLTKLGTSEGAGVEVPALTSAAAPAAVSQPVRLQVLCILVPAIARLSSYMRQECMQAVNRIFSSPHDFPLTSLLSEDMAVQMSTALLTAGAACMAEIAADSGAQELTGSAVGLICHVVLNFGRILHPEAVLGVVTMLVALLRTSDSDYVRYSVTMGFIHLFARDAQYTAQLLMQVPSPPEEGSTLRLMLERWGHLHRIMDSRYCRGISTIGLTKLVSLLSQHESNHSFAQHVLELMLQSLPSVVGVKEHWWVEEDNSYGDEDEGGEDGEVSDEDEDDEDEDEGVDFADEDYLDGEEWEQDDEGEDEGEVAGEAAQRKGKSPFAPAEMYYLSDMVAPSDSRGDEPLFVNVTPHLVFSPPSRDPLVATDIEGAVIDLLTSLQRPASDGLSTPEFPGWLHSVSPENKRLVQALLQSR